MEVIAYNWFQHHDITHDPNLVLIQFNAFQSFYVYEYFSN